MDRRDGVLGIVDGDSRVGLGIEIEHKELQIGQAQHRSVACKVRRCNDTSDTYSDIQGVERVFVTRQEVDNVLLGVVIDPERVEERVIGRGDNQRAANACAQQDQSIDAPIGGVVQ
jgi:hypothetical protein